MTDRQARIRRAQVHLYITRSYQGEQFLLPKDWSELDAYLLADHHNREI